MASVAPTHPDLASRLAAAHAPSECIRLAREIKRGQSDLGLSALRVAVLSSYSFNFADAFLVVEGAKRGYRIEPYYGAFGQLEQEVSGAELERFRPDLVILAWRPEDVRPDLAVQLAGSGGALDQFLEELVGRLAGAVRTLAEADAAAVLVANFAPPPAGRMPLGVFDAQVAEGIAERYHAANVALRAAVTASPGGFVWDYAGVVREVGAGGWTDPRLWALARVPVAAAHQPVLAAHLVRTVAGVTRPAAKCLVLDLDHTLWGGVIGDDGMEGLKLGDDFPGNAYKDLQRFALALRDRGVLLAVASKNDESTAREVFDRHPDMLVRWDHLAAYRINWEPKSANLQAIAAELNIGLDALVFFDDNPVERAEVQANAPDVRVVNVPADPLRYVETLAQAGHFDQPSLSSEDRGRAVLYQQQRARANLQRHAADPADFLRQLEMTATVGRADATTLGRIAQLVGKTNQFNLTTRRHGLADIGRMAESRDHIVAWLRLADRFGDQGLIAVGIVTREGRRAVIDTLLMSCRVMNREVERAFIAYLAEEVRAWECETIVGDYRPTKKNGMVRELYPQLGFAPGGPLPDGGTRFVFDLTSGPPAWPSVIRRAAA